MESYSTSLIIRVFLQLQALDSSPSNEYAIYIYKYIVEAYHVKINKTVATKYV